MVTYRIVDLTGPTCVTLEDGIKVYQVLRPELLAGHDVELDFEEIDLYSELFFFSAIGRLAKDLPSTQLSKRIVFRALKPEAIELAYEIAEKMQRYYSVAVD